MDSINHRQRKLTSKRSYFFKALYSWIIDNQLTPYIIIDAQFPGVQVPREYVMNDRITLNISSEATDLTFKVVEKLQPNSILAFQADFDEPIGIRFISVPIASVVAIYAYENGDGTVFPVEERTAEDENSTAIGEENNQKKLNVTLVE